jgi:hypothetical protein
MVAVFEILFLIVFVVLGLLWLRRTSLYRARRRSPRDPGQHGAGWGTHGTWKGSGGGAL